MKMFTRHVVKQLSAYIHGELTIEESRRVAEHLHKCERCRSEYDDIKLGARLAEHIPQMTAPAEMWSEIENLLDSQARKPAHGLPRRRFVFALSWQYAAAAAAAVILIAVVSIMWIGRRDTKPVAQGPTYPVSVGCDSWEVESLVGKIKIDDAIISGEGCFRTGELLETDSTSRARIKVAEIGHVELEPNSRVRLIETSETEHRLAMDRGTMHAEINAPPRLFFVDTPSAEAIDLGCAYTLEVDDDGSSLLHVTSGWVMLVRDGRESYVPMGAMCQTRPGIGPGTPYFDDSSQKLRDSLAIFDFDGGGDEALRVVLREARDKDTFTLWHLIQRVGHDQRSKVLGRMIRLVGLPEGVTREGIMSLDQDMLELWKEELDTVWFQ
jgi:ferric-dicitrate binding protein FerR (iron transport regulator)